jgi:hypothetical protein
VPCMSLIAIVTFIDLGVVAIDRIFFPRVTIRSLPDNVLLEIFSFYQMAEKSPQSSWHVLVHVCQTWRYIVFASPRRLHLQLICNGKTPVRKALGVWPRLPIIISDPAAAAHLGGVNIIAAVGHHDRVCKINLGGLTSGLLERLSTTMQVSFPALTYLNLRFYNALALGAARPESAPVLPNSFLGGSAPRLQSLTHLAWHSISGITKASSVFQ